MNAEDVFYYSKLSQLGIEEWVPVPDYDGSYEVSNLGRIRSLERRVSSWYRNTQVKGREQSTCLSAGGYLRVWLWKEGKQKAFTVHKLVALAFLGTRPNGLEVCHNDGLCSNNALHNLRYDTPKSNCADREKHGTVARGSKQGSAKLTENTVREIKLLLSEGRLLHRELAQRFGVCRSTISSISRGLTWKHI